MMKIWRYSKQNISLAELWILRKLKEKNNQHKSPLTFKEEQKEMEGKGKQA